MSLIAVHGGIDLGTDAALLQLLEEACQASYRLLAKGDHEKGVLDAVEGAVAFLEDHPRFNAGYGSVLNLAGQVEMDAAIMHGNTARLGAVAAIRQVAHPISVARKVLEESSHVLLVGQGATDFARARGFPPFELIFKGSLTAWEKATRGEPEGASRFNPFTGLPEEPLLETVGCVVCDDQGQLAAGSSTGGRFLKLPGRVGDSPICGAGIYASEYGAVVGSGDGEAFVELLIAKHAESLLRRGAHPAEAAAQAIEFLWQAKKTQGALLVLDKEGRVGAAHNSRNFAVSVWRDGAPEKLEAIQVRP